MGALDEGHFDVELENGVKLGCFDLSCDEEEEPETLGIEKAVKVLLQGLGEDVDREGLKKTPLRVAKAFLDGTRGYRQNVKDIVQGALFPEAGLCREIGRAGGAGGLVIVRDINLFSYCESCLLPFQVKCHVGYVPSGQRVVGLSKLSRVADVFAKRLQDPQRLADQIASALQSGIKPAGVAVILQCLHIHFPDVESAFLNSAQQGWLKVQVSAGSGVFENEKDGCWGDFFSLLKFRGINVEKTCTSDLVKKCWCPSQSPSSSTICPTVGLPDPRMVNAVASIILSLGEDPFRKELEGTPGRFVEWLMNFQTTNLQMKLNGCAFQKIDSLPKVEVSGQTGKIFSEMNLPFCSQCEHHLLPFYGRVHIGYFSREGFNPAGKPLLQSIVHFYGFKLQVQERLTRQIAESVSSLVGGDVMVVVEAYHTCMISRGIEKFGSNTATIAVLGRFSVDSAARTEFLDGISESNAE